MKTLLSLDPGKTTGVSIWEYDDETPLTCVQHFQIEDGYEGFLKYYIGQNRVKPFDVVVSESFRLDGRTPNPDITPLKIEGILETVHYQEDVPLYFQPNNFKAHVDNEKLKQHDLYWAGQPHAMDSARHALTWAKVQYHMPTLKKYFTIEE